MGNDFLEVTHDKFVFRVRKDYLYHPEGCRVKEGYSLGGFFMEKLN